MQDKKFDSLEKFSIDPLIDRKDLDFETIKNNPILKPVSEINNTHENLEHQCNRALWEYNRVKEAINEMVNINPKYSETILMAKVQELLIFIGQLVHAQDLQKKDMRKCIREMLYLCEDQYVQKESFAYDSQQEEPVEVKSQIEVKKPTTIKPVLIQSPIEAKTVVESKSPEPVEEEIKLDPRYSAELS